MNKIAVVGDVILDRYIYGEVNRINPEAMVPILDMKEQVDCLGGAANVANNLRNFKIDTYLFGYIGNDNMGKIIKQKLKEKGIKGRLFKTERTTLKTRFGNPQILRVDCEEKVSKTFDNEIIEDIKKTKPDLIIISDYAKGVITQNLFEELKKLKIKIIVDPKPKNKIDYSGCYLIAPNLKESKELVGQYKNILITKGKEGMSLIGERRIDIPTEAKEVYDVIGAGDTVIAALAVKLVRGENLEKAAIFANKMASIVVSKKGTSVIDEKIVFTNGCFDILHVGHISCLREAKKLGYLIVGLNSDNSVRKIKREPINSEEDRKQILESLGFVDEVIIFDEKNPINLIKKIKPDVYIKGGDYTTDTINQDERKIIEGYGCQIKFTPMIKEKSTTKIINKIKKNNEKSKNIQ